MTEDEYKRRTVEYQESIQPFIVQIVHLLQFRQPVIILDKGNIHMHYEWKDPLASELYDKYSKIIATIRNQYFS